MRTLTCILILSLIGSALPFPAACEASEVESRVDRLKQLYPDARIYQVTPEEFGRIEPVLRELEAKQDVSIIQLAQSPGGPRQTPPPGAPPAATPALTNTLSSATNAVTNQVHGASGRMPGEMGTVSPGSHSQPVSPAPDGYAAESFVRLVGDLSHIDSSSREFAIVIFVIVAAVVVLAVVVYAGVVLYDLLSGARAYSYWWDLETQASWLSGARNDGTLFGVKISAGVEDRATRVGLVLEGGHLNAKIHPEDRPDRVAVDGGFLMAGAGVRWGLGGEVLNPAYFAVELLAGGSSADNVDLMSTARAELSFGVGSNIRFGFSLGALYVGLHPTEGLLKDYDHFSTLLGVQAGCRF